MIIFRYLSKQLLATTVAVTVILLGIFMSQRLVRYLAEAASGELPGTIVFYLLGFHVPAYVGLLLPLSFYIAILWVYGRLYAEHEMTILKACGVGEWRLLGMTLLPALLLTGVAAIFTLWLSPLARTAEGAAKLESASPRQEVRALASGRFQEVSKGKGVIYAESRGQKAGELQNVFVASQGTQEKVGVLSAKTGELWVDPKTRAEYVVFKNGHRYEGAPGQSDYTIVEYKRYAIKISHPPVDAARQKREGKSTLALWKSTEVKDIAELQWRFALPFAVLVLCILAVPLSHTHPREGKFQKLLPALLLAILFSNLLTLARHWAEDGVVPLWLGPWWVLLVFGVLGLAWIFYDQSHP